MAFDIQGAMKAGYSQQEIQQYLQQKGGQASIATQQPTPQETLPQSQGFDWTSLLPIAGAVGGSFIPGLGNIVGGAAGAGLGALLRQGLKNEPINPGEVAKQAAFAGVGGVGGKLLGGLVGKFLPGILGKVGEGAIGSQYNVPRNVARAINFPESIKTLAGQGITDMSKIPAAAEAVTGANGIISQLTRKAVAGANPVELGGIQTARGEIPSIIDMADSLTMNPSITANTGSKFMKFIEKGIQQTMGGEQGNITGTANPSEVFGLIQQLEKAATGVTRGRAPTAITAEDTALANSYKSIADELRHRLFNISGADEAVASGLLTPEQLTTLNKISPQLAKQVQSAQTVADLRAAAAPYVQGNQAAAETAAGSRFGFQNLNGQAQGVGKLIPSLTNPLAPIQAGLSQPGVNAAIGGAALKGANVLKSLPLPNLTKTGVAAGATMGQGDNQSSQPRVISELMGNNTSQPQVNLASNQPVSSNDDAMRKLFFALMLKNPKQASLLSTIYNFGYPKPPSQTADRAASLQSGIGAIDQALKESGGFGPIQGRIYETQLQHLGGAGVPENVVNMETQYNLLRQNIVRAFQGARMSDQDMKIALSYTPSLSDTPGTAKAKLNTLKRMLVDLQTSLKNNPGQDTSIPQPASLGG